MATAEQGKASQQASSIGAGQLCKAFWESSLSLRIHHFLYLYPCERAYLGWVVIDTHQISRQMESRYIDLLESPAVLSLPACIACAYSLGCPAAKAMATGSHDRMPS